jgi:hypothetical protein
MENVEELHEKFKKLSTLELCDLLVMYSKVQGSSKLVVIIKTYIARSIAAEGIE